MGLNLSFNYFINDGTSRSPLLYLPWEQLLSRMGGRIQAVDGLKAAGKVFSLNVYDVSVSVPFFCLRILILVRLPQSYNS